MTTRKCTGSSAPSSALTSEKPTSVISTTSTKQPSSVYPLLSGTLIHKLLEQQQAIERSLTGRSLSSPKMQSLPRSKSPTPAGPREFKGEFSYRRGNKRAIAKDAALAMSYGKNVGAVWPDEMDTDWFGDTLYRTYGGVRNLRKGDFELLAAAVLDIKKQLVSMALDNPMGRPDAAAIGEMVAARLGLVLANGNDKFDGFKWAAACKGEKE